MVDWRKTTSEIILDFYPYIGDNDGLFKLWVNRHPNNSEIVWIRADKVQEEINRIFEKFRVPDKEPKLMVEGLGDLVNHPISAFHAELIEVLGLLENGELITSEGVIGEKDKSKTPNKQHFLDKKAPVSSPKKQEKR
jgi:hypothetical protein